MDATERAERIAWLTRRWEVFRAKPFPAGVPADRKAELVTLDAEAADLIGAFVRHGSLRTGALRRVESIHQRLVLAGDEFTMQAIEHLADLDWLLREIEAICREST